jgi:membrane-bound lytic murein transglycosylase D
MKKVVFYFFLFLSLNIGLNAKSVEFEYEWTNNHPILNDYIKKNRDNVLRITPYSNKKSQDYKKFIEAVIKVIDVPKELIVLAAIESNYNPKAVSKAGATGMWQFMKPTAIDMGLKVSDRVDERTNWRKSTVAAIKYLKWMSEKHFDGDYELSILAYNAGIGNVQRAIKKHNTKNPWELIKHNTLKQESKDYLPKFIAYMNYYYYIEKYGKFNK